MSQAAALKRRNDDAATTRVHVPLLYDRAGADWSDRTRLKITPVDIVTIDPAAAPVVASMMYHPRCDLYVVWPDNYEGARRIDFRFHNGALLHRVGEADVDQDRTPTPALVTGPIDTFADRWAAALKDDAVRIGNHPCLVGGKTTTSHTKIVDGEVDDPDYREQARLLHGRVQRMRMIDGEIWGYGRGPTYGHRTMHETLDGRTVSMTPRHPGGGRLRPCQVRQNIFAPTQLPAIRDLYADMTGRTFLENPFWEIDVVDPAAFTDFDDLALEQAIWDLVWNIKKLKCPDLGRAAVHAIVEFRQIVAAGRSSRVLNFDPGFHETNWPHETQFAAPKLGRDDDLLDAMEKVLDLCGLESPAAKAAPDTRMAIARARMNPRLSARMDAPGEADDRALESLAF